MRSRSHRNHFADLWAKQCAARERWQSNLSPDVPVAQPYQFPDTAGRQDARAGTKLRAASALRERSGVVPVPTAGRSGPLTPLNLVLPWPPSGNHATRHPSRGVHYLTDAHKVFRKAVAAIVMQVRAKQVASPYSATVVWHPPNRRHVDSDNLQKTLFDALQKAGVIENDSLHHKIAYSETVVWPTKPQKGAVHVQIREQP